MFQLFTYQHCPISYRVIGQGKPVLLLHGFGEDSQIWHHQIQFLTPYCQLIVPNLPGTGLSPNVADTQAVLSVASSIDAIAGAMLALLEEIKINQPVTVLGHSMGGYVALAMARQQPATIGALGLVHSTAFADSEAKKVMRQKAIQFISEKGGNAFMQTAIPSLFSDKYNALHPEKVAELVEAATHFSPKVLAAYYVAMMNRPDCTDVLSHLGKPILFVMGTEDKAVPMADVLQQTHLPGIAFVQVLPGVAHMGLWEQPEAINEILLNFLTEAALFTP